MSHRRLSVPGVAFLVVMLAQVCQAQPQSPGDYTDNRQLPDSPRHKRVTELLDVLNSGDQARVRKLVDEAFTDEFRKAVPMEEHLGIFRELYTESHGLEFYSIRQYQNARSEDEIVVIAKNKLTDGWHGIVMQVETKPPHRIAGIMFNPARPPKELPPPAKLSRSQLASEVKAFVEKMVQAEVFSGTVLLAKDNQVLFSGAYGQACKSYDVPNKLDTKFNLGSMNKMFTAVAVAQLAERGKLSYDDTLDKYLSTDWLPQELAAKIKISHLLSHTSGLGSYFNEKFDTSSRELYRSVNDYKPLVADEKLQFEPGTNWSYSNTGFLLAGAVIEKVTGESYFDFVRKNIFEPAGMTNTDSYEMDKVVPNLAIGYVKDVDATGKTVWTNNLYKHVIKGGPAGGGFSTVEDLHRFDRALRTNKLLSQKSRDELWTAQPNAPDYGFGFMVMNRPGGRVVGHGGGFPGISSQLSMFLDSGYTLVVLSNYDNGARPVEQKITSMLANVSE